MAIQFNAGVEISTAAWRLARTPHSNIEVLKGEGAVMMGSPEGGQYPINLQLAISKSWLKMDKCDLKVKRVRTFLRKNFPSTGEGFYLALQTILN